VYSGVGITIVPTCCLDILEVLAHFVMYLVVFFHFMSYMIKLVLTVSVGIVLMF